MMDRPRKPHYSMTLRLKPTMGELLETLAKRKSLDKTTIIALGLQALAMQEGVPIPIARDEGEAEG